MSVVVVTRSDDTHTLVADSAMSTHTFVNSGVKVHRIGRDVIVGFCGSPEVLTMFKAYLQENPIGAVESFDESRAYQYMSLFYDFLESRGFSVMDKETPEQFEVAIVTPWRILIVQRYFVHEVDTFFSLGAGDEIAQSALHLGHNAAEAAELACSLSPWCSLPLVTHTIQRKHTHEHEDK